MKNDNKMHKLIENVICEYLLAEGSDEQKMAGILNFFRELSGISVKRILRDVSSAILLELKGEGDSEVSGKMALLFVNFLFNFSKGNDFHPNHERWEHEFVQNLDWILNHFEDEGGGGYKNDFEDEWDENQYKKDFQENVLPPLKNLVSIFVKLFGEYRAIFNGALNDFKSKTMWNERIIPKILEIQQKDVKQKIGEEFEYGMKGGWQWVYPDREQNEEFCERMGHCGHDSGIMFYLLEDYEYPVFTITYNNKLNAITEARGIGNEFVIENHKQMEYTDFILDFMKTNEVKTLRLNISQKEMMGHGFVDYEEIEENVAKIYEQFEQNGIECEVKVS